MRLVGSVRYHRALTASHVGSTHRAARDHAGSHITRACLSARQPRISTKRLDGWKHGASGAATEPSLWLPDSSQTASVEAANWAASPRKDAAKQAGGTITMKHQPHQTKCGAFHQDQHVCHRCQQCPEDRLFHYPQRLKRIHLFYFLRLSLRSE